MSTLETTIAHVARSVVSHKFTDPSDWLDGLNELAELTDEEIEMLATDRVPALPRLPLGVSEKQAAADRALFDRVVAEIKRGCS